MGTTSPGLNTTDNYFRRILWVAGSVTKTATMREFILLECLQGNDVTARYLPGLSSFFCICICLNSRTPIFVRTYQKCGFGQMDGGTGSKICDRYFLLEIGFVLCQTGVHDKVAVRAAKTYISLFSLYSN